MKLIFLDIDGTLVEPGCMEPSQKVMEAIRSAQRHGHKVFLATGRSKRMMERLLALGFDGALCSAGGYVCINGQKVYDCPIPTDLAQSTRKFFEDAGMGLILECENGSYGAESFGKVIAQMENGSSELERWQKNIRSGMGIDALKSYDGEPIYKMCFATHKKENLALIRDTLEENFKVCLFDFRPGLLNGEIIYKAFDKGRAMAKVCEYYGASLADTIAFGDSANDAEMLLAAGIGYCMANGSEQVKKIADRICPSVKEDGVAVAFAELGLC